MSGVRWRFAAVGVLILLFAYLTGANFVPKRERLESPLLPDGGVRLGLDLQGGIHWVVGVELEVAVRQELEFMRDNLVDRLAEEDVVPDLVAVRDQGLVVELASPEHMQAVREYAEETGVLEEESAGPARVVYGLTDDWTQQVRDRTMAQVLEVLRRRIDDPVRGIPDSVVTRQGSDRVLVQIPGGQIDRGRARSLLKSTGFLELKLVLDAADSEELLLARHPDGIPENAEIVHEIDPETQQVIGAYLVRETADLTGKYLTDARVRFDNRQRPFVQFQFNSEGGRLFQELTGESIGERLAIILDDKVYSAPVIRSRIASRGQIEGRFTTQQAADLAVVLRAGSLSVPVVIEEERTVGPALGQDSIDAGVRASLLGLLLVVGFIIGYYRLSGGYASFALFSNFVLLIGLMSLSQATLTLPGIAGLVLTVGMAVDANVIIFERIREELASGKTPRASVGAGFRKATWTVLDANITTLITALILFEFGTGPIKGFAVTLSIGIVTSVFAALVVTRLLYQIHPGARPVQALSI